MDKIESNFELLGATAIEDKLQVEKAGGRREGGREGVVIALERGLSNTVPWHPTGGRPGDDPRPDTRRHQGEYFVLIQPCLRHDRGL